jgi:hypothetical protein
VCLKVLVAGTSPNLMLTPFAHLLGGLPNQKTAFAKSFT